MSFFDSAKEKFQDLAADHPDQVEQLSDQAVTRGGDAVAGGTGGTYADQVDPGLFRADEASGRP